MELTGQTELTGDTGMAVDGTDGYTQQRDRADVPISVWAEGNPMAGAARCEFGE